MVVRRSSSTTRIQLVQPPQIHRAFQQWVDVRIEGLPVGVLITAKHQHCHDRSWMKAFSFDEVDENAPQDDTSDSVQHISFLEFWQAGLMQWLTLSFRYLSTIVNFLSSLTSCTTIHVSFSSTTVYARSSNPPFLGPLRSLSLPQTSQGPQKPLPSTLASPRPYDHHPTREFSKGGEKRTNKPPQSLPVLAIHRARLRQLSLQFLDALLIRLCVQMDNNRVHHFDSRSSLFVLV